MILGKIEVHFGRTDPKMIRALAEAEERLDRVMKQQFANVNPADLLAMAAMWEAMMQGIHEYFAHLFGNGTAKAILEDSHDAENHLDILNSFREQCGEESAEYARRMGAQIINGGTVH